MGFKENLRDEITYQGLLVKEVAAKAGLPSNALSNYLRENSSIPSADIAVKIAAALGVSVEYLVTGNNPSSSNKSKPIKSYSAEIRHIADNLEKMNSKELNLVNVLVKEIVKDSAQKESATS